MAEQVKAGRWVEIYSVVLEAGNRAPQVPEDTAQVPLELKIKGFLKHDAEVGDDVEIESVIGREHKGKLIDSSPAYLHSYGQPIPELLRVGRELKEILRNKRGEE